MAGLLVLIDRTRKLRAGSLFALYVLGYAIGRFWVEALRIDQASLIWGIRVNIWMSIIIGGAAGLYLLRNHFRPDPDAPDREHEAETAEQLAADAEAELASEIDESDEVDAEPEADPVQDEADEADESDEG